MVSDLIASGKDISGIALSYGVAVVSLIKFKMGLALKKKENGFSISFNLFTDIFYVLCVIHLFIFFCDFSPFLALFIVFTLVREDSGCYKLILKLGPKQFPKMDYEEQHLAE